MAASAAALVVAVALSVAVVRGGHHTPQPRTVSGPTSATGPTRDSVLQDEEAIQRVLDLYNRQSAGAIAIVGGTVNFSPARCWAGWAADFPGEVLLTLIQPSGLWVQVDVDQQTGPDLTSIRNGTDYRLAGIDPTLFDATAFQCEMDRRSGAVQLVDLFPDQS